MADVGRADRARGPDPAGAALGRSPIGSRKGAGEPRRNGLRGAMKPDQALRLSSAILAASGFTALALTGELPIALLVAGAAALLASLTPIAPWKDPEGSASAGALLRLSRPTWNALLLTAFAGFLADWLWISMDLLPAGIHFLVLLMISKLLTLQERKDFLHLYAISLLELLSAAALTTELWYAAVFVVFLLATIWTLLLYHLRNEAEELASAPSASGTPVDPVHRPGPLTSRFFWTTNRIAIGAFCLTLAIFFLTPRIGAGFFNKHRGEQIRTTGFSEQVDLGAMGAIKLDQTVVMRVEFPERSEPLSAAERIYFRGAAFDVYNGRSWSKRSASRRLVWRTADGLFKVAPDQTPHEGQTGLRQDILIEALDTTTLFAASFVSSVKSSFDLLRADEMDALSLPYTPMTRFQYSAWSFPDHVQDEERIARNASYPQEIADQYLQMPELSPRVSTLARQVTAQARTPYDRIVAIEGHLRSAYQYSLDVGPTVPVHPVEEFLFARKTGYCEHYATAMVMMLRTLGIPARLVTGFLPGEWNGFGRYYTIRQRDAHAWVEVYFPRSGWVTFDPTPSVPAAASNQLWAGAGRVIDSIRLKWDRFIIQYSLRDQIKVAQGIREQSEKVRGQALGLVATVHRWTANLQDWIRQLALSPENLLTAVWGGGLLLLLLITTWVWRQHRRNSRPSEFPTVRQATVVRLYGRMLQLLAARGIVKAPGTTAVEFAGMVIRDWSDAGLYVAPLTELYCRVRFGQAPLSPQELQQAEALLNGLRNAAQQGNS
ncbi:MAG: DUF3488 domain-containing protein [Nitrospirae bacterium]|nr:MAG: DUF3488 domain-containing protein [Nitrospirota bacterium]